MRSCRFFYLFHLPFESSVVKWRGSVLELHRPTAVVLYFSMNRRMVSRRLICAIKIKAFNKQPETFMHKLCYVMHTLISAPSLNLAGIETPTLFIGLNSVVIGKRCRLRCNT